MSDSRSIDKKTFLNERPFSPYQWAIFVRLFPVRVDTGKS
jgi:hypothetical protein